MRAHVLITVAVAVALCVPALLSGPGPLADDWVFLRNARFDGWLHAAGPRLASRPGGAFVYDLTFGLIGNRPLILAFVQAMLLAVVAVAILYALRAFVAPSLALAATIVWLAVPNHSSLEHWFSTAPALVALGLLAVGVGALARSAERDASPLLAHVALAAAITCYEPTAAVALCAVVAVPLMRGRRPTLLQTVFGVALVFVPIEWSVTQRTVYEQSPGWLDPTLVLPGHLSLGFAGFGAQGRLVTGVGLAIMLAVVAHWLRVGVSSLAEDEQLVLAGAALLVLGVVPIARFPTNFLGLDDRLTVVGGVGAAMVWAGGAAAGMRLAGRAPARVLAPVLLVALACIVVPLRIDRERDYRGAADAALAEATRLVAATNGERVVEVVGALANVGRVYGLNDGWNASAAVQVLSGDPTRVVHTDGIGPDPDDPTQAFR
jgi:hypothetical protein